MLVGEAALDQSPDKRRAQLGRNDLLDPGTIEPARGQLALHQPDDVAALAHPAKRILQPLGEPVVTTAKILGQLHAPQLAQSAGGDRLLERIVVGGGHLASLIHTAQKAAVDRGQSLLVDIVPQPRLDLKVGSRPQIERNQLGRALAQPVRDIFAGDDEIVAAIVDAAQHDMGVRALGVEVIERDPVELRSQVLLDLRHQAPHVGSEVGIFGAVLGGYDETELVPVAGGPLEEIIAVGAVDLRTVEFARQTLASDPVALNVAHVCAGDLTGLAVQPDEARLDHRSATAKAGETVAARQQSPDARAPPDAAALEAACLHSGLRAGEPTPPLPMQSAAISAHGASHPAL